MKKFPQNAVCAVIATALLAALTSSCGQRQIIEEPLMGSGVTLSSDTEVYPMKSNDTLTVWVAMQDSAKLKYSNLAETPFGKQWMEETGVNVEFTHPTSGNAAEQFNLLLTSEKKPDIIIYDWYSVAGGPQKYINEKVIWGLNSIIDQYSPNLKKYLTEHPDTDRAVKTDDGEYYVYPFIRGDERLTVSSGPIVRKSIRDELGMDVPETIDEWYTMLKGAKEKGVKAPLSYSLLRFEANGVFSGAYGVPKGFFVDDSGKVQYGPAMPQTKDYLREMNKWFNEGLLDQNISNV